MTYEYKCSKCSATVTVMGGHKLCGGCRIKHHIEVPMEDEIDELLAELNSLRRQAGFCAENLKKIKIILQRIDAINNPNGDEVTWKIAREAEAIIQDIESHGEGP